MVILHYSLGFPPYRSGGLTKFCFDLMRQQVKQGDQVSLIWPGRMGLFGRTTRIQNHKAVEGIKSYEIINPLPVSYDEGIIDVDRFIDCGEEAPYRHFLEDLMPDVIHVHTLMGLHEHFLTAAKALNIRLVFTAHDFFPICPKVTIFRNGQNCSSFSSCKECQVCNSTALSFRQIWILQSALYRVVKDVSIVRKMRKKHRDAYLLSDAQPVENDLPEVPGNYKRLRIHFQTMLEKMDLIHYNSSLTKRIYEEVVTLKENKVIPITHADISDKRSKKEFSDNMLRIRYLGPMADLKGYYLLKKALDRLWEEKKQFRLAVHFTPESIPPYMDCYARYGYTELGDIFEKTDLLVCPSKGYETFGYTVLEALSYGVPVLISDTVGAKDIVADGAGIVFTSGDENVLYYALQQINADKLRKMNQVIMERQKILPINQLCQEITKQLYEVR